jgi:hypothetical protein
LKDVFHTRKIKLLRFHFFDDGKVALNAFGRRTISFTMLCVTTTRDAEQVAGAQPAAARLVVREDLVLFISLFAGGSAFTLGIKIGLMFYRVDWSGEDSSSSI